jgi:DtxR family Mn-dependent transcriptional regulator
MADPATALLWFALLALVGAVVVWPGRGVLARIGRVRGMSQRVLVEDALKHLINCELAGETATMTTLAGALEISRARAHDLAALVVSQGFCASDGQGIRLTDAGRGYALRVLRTHRLLERYFADRTGLPPAEWHDLAERGEHRLSADEAEELAHQMGDPVLDPHGDPIPTRTGRLPPPQGVSLGSLEPGATATVIHVEDEPGSVFRRLVSSGFQLGVPVKVIRRLPTHLDLLVAGRPATLEAHEAGAVTVEPVAEAVGHTVLFERLDALSAGERAEVVEIAPMVQGAQRRRLLDLGVLPGTEIAAEVRSPSGDPTAYRIRGALIALRRAQARGVYIRRSPVPVDLVAAARPEAVP